MVCYLRDVHSVLQLRSLATGRLRQEIPLPGIGSVYAFNGRRHDSEAFFSFTSFVDPGSTFRQAPAARMPTLPMLASCKRTMTPEPRVLPVAPLGLLGSRNDVV